jgi:hypothetical protein
MVIVVPAILYTCDQNEPSVPFLLKLECSNPEEFRDALLKAAESHFDCSDPGSVEDFEYKIGDYGPMVEFYDDSLIVGFTKELQEIGVQVPD